MKRLAAILEVVGVYMTGQLVMVLIARALGLQLTNPLKGLQADATQADLLSRSGQLALLLILQYVGLLSAAFLVGWWHRRRRPSQYGITLDGQPLTKLAWSGVVLFATAGVWSPIVHLVDSYVPLGQTVAWRETIFTMPWTPAFWVFSAVGSYLLIPPLEELFYRGYVQARLGEDWGAPVAIAGAAALFVLSHGQYHRLDALNASTLVAMVIFAVGLGYTFWRTRSLVPCIVAHALVNVPARGIGSWLVIGACLLVLVMERKWIARHLGQLFAQLRGPYSVNSGEFAVLGLGLFAFGISAWENVTTMIGLAAMVIALVLEWRDRRKV